MVQPNIFALTSIINVRHSCGQGELIKHFAVLQLAEDIGYSS